MSDPVLPPSPTNFAFPANITWTISEMLGRCAYVDNVVRRPIRMADANLTAAVHVESWQPGPDPYEIGQEEPVVQRYPFQVGYLVKGMGDEADLHNVHSVGSKHIRAMLYRDEAFGLQLRQLSEDLAGTRERAKRMVCVRQRFFAGRLRTNMAYLSVLEGYVETETVRL